MGSTPVYNIQENPEKIFIIGNMDVNEANIYKTHTDVQAKFCKASFSLKIWVI